MLVLQHDLSPYIVRHTPPPNIPHAILHAKGKTLDYAARKLLLETYHRDPTGKFYQLLGALPTPLVHLLGEQTKESPLAQALRIQDVSTNLVIDASKLGTRDELAHELVTGEPRMNEFREQFMLGALQGSTFKCNSNQLLKRLDIQDATPFQHQYLSTNPYFTLDWETMTLHFQSPFNNTHATHVPLHNVTEAWRTHGTPVDTILNFDYRVVGAISRHRRVAARIVPFTPEEIYKHNLKPTTLEPYNGGGNVAGILTHQHNVELRLTT
tara:strand:- start:1379 stop:2182 length:804 start_codon:yes stop_codon:yes gene_type:complete